MKCRKQNKQLTQVKNLLPRLSMKLGLAAFQHTSSLWQRDQWKTVGVSVSVRSSLYPDLKAIVPILKQIQKVWEYGRLSQVVQKLVRFKTLASEFGPWLSRAWNDVSELLESVDVPLTEQHNILKTVIQTSYLSHPNMYGPGTQAGHGGRYEVKDLSVYDLFKSSSQWRR